MDGLERFYGLLDACNAAQGEERRALEEEIWRQFGVERTVMVLDMAGFSSKVRQFGLLYFLRKIRYMQTVVRPLLAEWRGELVKFEADNAYAIFDAGTDAVGCGVAIHQELRRRRDGSPDVDDVSVCIGLAAGRILLIPGCDLFGDAVNLASRLGEDLARENELLAEPRVAEAAKGRAGLEFKPLHFDRPGGGAEAVQIEYQ